MGHCLCREKGGNKSRVITYDNRMNTNEWFILSGLCIGILIVCLLPKRFPRKLAIIYFLCGVFTGFFFDHTLSLKPFNCYDVNDTSKFNLMDFISYWMYGPFSYLFFYILDYIKLKPSFWPVYVLVSSLVSLGFEWAASSAGVFHYKNHFSMYDSFPIYLIVQSIWILLFHHFQSQLHRDSS
jgi:hypothetical protein